VNTISKTLPTPNGSVSKVKLRGGRIQPAPTAFGEAVKAARKEELRGVDGDQGC
jgi:hypothetical protein